MGWAARGVEGRSEQQVLLAIFNHHTCRVGELSPVPKGKDN